ncbi:tetracenomycin polyketide synthesis O-methyltransferase TcmP [Xylariales sp. PMI_506]|nr:tetracenomycin polyketide synthesis O-methyltransferase TcmP [Xylariales sp. PMI_506]
MSLSTRSSSSVKQSVDREKVNLTGVEETLLAAIWCRAKDAESANPLLGDPYAQMILNRCDVDYTRSTFAALHDERWAQFIAGRAKKLDVWCQEFLKAHGAEPVQVLQLACGLDSRALRISRGSNVRWIDLDRPFVINLRERIYKTPPTGDYSLRNLSVTNESWLNDIPQDRPTLIIAEGLLMYLQPAQSKKVITDVVDYFEHGGEIIFDTLGTVLQKYTSQVQWLKSSKAAFTWGVDNYEEIVSLRPQLRLIDQRYWYEYMGVERKVSNSPPWFGNTITKLASILPSFNDFGQIMRFEFQRRVSPRLYLP